MSSKKPLSIYIIAGEVSGDLLGGKLLKALNNKKLSYELHGIGGTKMQEQGLKSLFPMNELSLMGFAEIVPHIPRLLKRIKQTVEDIKHKKPDLVVTIDSPGFTTRVVKALREEQFKGLCVHYVAPSVWAYKPERVHKMKRLFDHLLTLLPFEPKYFEKVGLPSTFVGHSIIEDQSGQGDAARFRKKHKLKKEYKILCVLPGSRDGEIKRHLKIFSTVIRRLYKRDQNLAVVIPTTKKLEPQIKKLQKRLDCKVIVTTDEQDKFDAYAASTAALAKSGTVTLELAIAKTPMVVTYKVGKISAWMMRRMILTPYVCLINILQQKEIVKEYLQEDCHPDTLTAECERLLNDSDYAKKQLKGMDSAIKQLSNPSGELPSEIAANTIIDLISDKIKPTKSTRKKSST